MSGCTSPTPPGAKGGGAPAASTTAGCATPCLCCKQCPCVSKKSQVPTIAPLFAAKDSKCGGYDWKVWFNLPEKTCNGGWIVQEYRATIERRNRAGALLSMETYHYWEAWEVKKCKKATVWQDEGLDDNDDQYFYCGSGLNTKGSFIVVGLAKFYEGPLPADFVKNNPKTLAGILHATTKKPAFWDGGGVTHNLSSTWDCTDGTSHPSQITTVP